MFWSVNFRTAVLTLSLGLVAACTSNPPDAQRVQAEIDLPVIDSGSIGRAPYRVDIPSNWNGDLVMLLHGYEPKGVPRASPWPQDEASSVFLTQGYAVAQSAYSSQGWAVADAISDNEQLRAYFTNKYKKPRRTFLVGFSLGGYVALASLERFGANYGGALSLCGVNVPATRVFEDAQTALVAFDYFFPHADGLPSGGLSDPASPPQDQRAMAGAIALALKSNEAASQILSKHTRSLSLQYLVLHEMKARAGGIPIDNRTTVYSGFGDDVAFNKGVHRYSGDKGAIKYLSDSPTLTGRINKPLILQYNYDDPTIPERYNFIYPMLVKQAGHASLVVVLPSTGEGHCDFSPDQIHRAFKDLADWASSGQRPAKV